MFARCYLHIGLRRTGNAAIHAALARNRETLLAQGCYVPLWRESADLPALALYARGEGAPDHPQARALAGRGTDHGAFRAGLEKWIDGLASRDGGGTRAVILSSPAVHDVLDSPEQFDRLATLTRRIARETVVVLLLRRQDRVATSLAAAAILDGAGPGAPLLPHLTAGLPYFYRYADIVEDAASAFGSDAIAIRVVREEARGGDAVEELRAVIGVPEKAEWISPGRVGRALAWSAQRVLAQDNQSPQSPEDRAERNRRLTMIDGGRRLSTRGRAKRFVAAFAAQNARLAERLCPEPGRVSPFDDDFTENPEGPLDQPLTTKESARIAALLERGQDTPLEGGDQGR